MGKKSPAKAVANWREDDDVWLDHATITADDLDWLAPARRLTLWAVDLPEGFLARLPTLEWIDLRGGSGRSADLLRGCSRLRYISLNQIRGLSDVNALSEITSVELLSLFGLPQVRELPSLRRLNRLRRIELGSLKGTAGIGPFLDAPEIAELQLTGPIGLERDAAERVREHPTLTHFTWSGEGVPDRVLVPFRDAVAKPAARIRFPSDWFESR